MKKSFTLGSEGEGTLDALRPDVLDVVCRPLREKGKPKAFARAIIQREPRTPQSPRDNLQ